MADLLLYFDESGYNKALGKLEEGKAKINEIIADYNNLGLEKPLTTQELRDLFFKPEDVIFDKMTDGQGVVIGDVKLSKARAIDILEKPPGYSALIEKLNRYKRDFLDSVQFDNRFLSPLGFQLNAGVLEIEPTQLTELEESYKFYATTPEQQAFYTQLQVIADALNAIRTIKPGKFGERYSHNVAEIIEESVYSTDGITVLVDHQAVAKF